jgi:hypothetical protein
VTVEGVTSDAVMTVEGVVVMEAVEALVRWWLLWVLKLDKRQPQQVRLLPPPQLNRTNAWRTGELTDEVVRRWKRPDDPAVGWLHVVTSCANGEGW